MKWYEHQLEAIVENDIQNMRFLSLDRSPHWNTNLIFIDKENSECQIIELAVGIFSGLQRNWKKRKIPERTKEAMEYEYITNSCSKRHCKLKGKLTENFTWDHDCKSPDNG